MQYGTSILHGPFPVRVGRFFGALAAVAVAVGLCALGLETQHLRCDFAAQGTCTFETFVSKDDDARFATRDLGAVRVEKVFRGKGRGKEYGVVVLPITNREIRLMDATPDEAREIAGNIESARSRGAEFRTTLEGPRWFLLLAPAIALMGLSLAWMGVRRMGALVLSFGHDGSLRVERRVLGAPIAARSFSLSGVVDVALEWGVESDFWRGRHEQPRQAGRIVITTRDGRFPLSDQFWPGQTLHYRAAAELRRNLGLPPGEIERELHVLENTLVRPALARTPGGRFALYWISISCGSLLGLAVFGLVGFALGLLRASDGLEPWMLLVGCGGGIVAAIALMLRLTRPRAPR